MSGWNNGAGAQNLDPTFLAQTMINVAQNLISTQQQQNAGRRSHETSPWAGGSPAFQGILGAGPGSAGGRSSLLGSGPGGGGDLGDRSQRMSQQLQKHHPQMSSGPVDPWLGRDQIMLQDKQIKNNKNYLPKIKEEGCKPHYYPEEFESIPSPLLQCNLCGKDPMWDGGSFVRHLLGNSHNQALEKLIETDVEKVGKLRKAIAEKIKKEKGTGNSKCGMCDVRVKDIIQHRKDEVHGKLRKFIHPHCEACDADFEDRSDWYYHKYSAHHLHGLHNTNKQLNYSPMSSKDIDNIITKLEKQIGKQLVSPEKKSSNSVSRNDKNKSEKKKESQNLVVEDDEIVIMEEKKSAPSGPVSEEDLENMDVVGAEFIKPVNGLFCKLCKKFFMADHAEVVQHCRSPQHVESVQMIENQTGIKRKSAAEFFDAKKAK